MRKMFEITGIGANVFDTLVKLPAFPVEDTKVYAQTVVSSGGGPVGTGLTAAAKLGAKCALLAVLSNDSGGQFLLQDSEKYGVDTSLVQIRDGESFSATVLLNQETGSRTCLLNRGTLPKLELTEAHAEAIRNSKVLMVDGNELEAAVQAAKLAKESGTRVLYDAGGRYEGVERLLALTDILIPSIEFACGFTGKDSPEDAAMELFRTFAPEIVVVTCGKDGGVLFDGKHLSFYPFFSVPVCDTNGAGDVFHGAFAFGVTRGWEYSKCAAFSSAVSALKCTKVGARQAVPTYEEAVQLMEEGELH